MARMTPEQLKARLAKAAKRVIEDTHTGMQKAALNIEARAKLNCTPGSSPYPDAPFDKGLLRAEIYHAVEIHGNAVQGFIISPTEYAEPVHEGSSRKYARPFLLDAIVSERDATQKFLAEDIAAGLEAA